MAGALLGLSALGVYISRGFRKEEGVLNEQARLARNRLEEITLNANYDVKRDN